MIARKERVKLGSVDINGMRGFLRCFFVQFRSGGERNTVCIPTNDNEDMCKNSQKDRLLALCQQTLAVEYIRIKRVATESAQKPEEKPPVFARKITLHFKIAILWFALPGH